MITTTLLASFVFALYCIVITGLIRHEKEIDDLRKELDNLPQPDTDHSELVADIADLRHKLDELEKQSRSV